MAGNTPDRAGTRLGLKHILTLYILHDCTTCGTHLRPLFKKHELCRQFHHGIKAGNTTMIVLKHRRLAHVSE